LFATTPVAIGGIAMKLIIKPKPTYFSGLDLGPANEVTALAIVERTVVGSGRTAVRQYAVRHLLRFEQGTRYTEIAAYLARRFTEPYLAQSRLMVDQTMVGRPVVQLLRDARIQAKISPLVITAGLHSGMGECGVMMVPKVELVSTLIVLFQALRLTVAPALPEAALLVKELVTFDPRHHAPRSDDIVDWREAPHDDLVFAVAIAIWQGEREVLPAVDSGPFIISKGCPGIEPGGWRGKNYFPCMRR
jgi:hypothetical protein